MFDLLQQRDERAPTTFAEPGSGTSFAQRIADVAGELTPSRIAQAVGDVFSPEGREMTRSALDATMYSKLLSSRDEAMAEAAARRIAAIKEATGVELENPFLGGYGPAARRRVREQRVNPDYDLQGGIPAAARQIFDEKTRALIAEQPDKVRGLGLDVPLEAIRNNIATGAEERQTIARATYEASGRTPGGALLSELIGGAAGGSRDPLSIATWVAGPTGGIGRTVAARMINEGLTQGAFNLGLTAVEKPAAQAFREERGQPEASSLLTVEEAARAFGFGFLGGAGVRGGIEAGKAIFQAGQRILRADRAALDERPPNVSQETHEAALDQAIRHTNDPAHEAPPPAVIAAAAGEREAELAAIVRGSGEAPTAPMAARENAIALAEEKGLPPEYAEVAATQAPNPSDHGPVLDRLAQERPQTEAEARVVAADEVEGQAARRQTAELQEATAPKPRIGTVPEERRSLLQFLAGRGGVAQTEELAAIFGGKSSYVRPYGKLLRDGESVSMAERAEQAFTAGYIAEPSERALLTAVEAEFGGAKVYRREFAAEGVARDVEKAEKAEAKAATEKARTELFNYLAETGSEIRPAFPGNEAGNKRIFKDAVAALASGQETDVAEALRKAAAGELEKQAEKMAKRRKQPEPDAMELIPSQDDQGRALVATKQDIETRIEDRQSFADLVRACKE